MERRRNGKYTNPCLTMHQPWASLLVHGIKRIEGRSWPPPLRGRLWIHAASKVPDDATIKVMEDFYREIYAVNGITDLKFPQHYPVSRLIGCVEVVGCLRREELACWKEVPEALRLEGLTEFCWLCEQPQKLIAPVEMRGYQGVYNLERKTFESAVGGLVPVKSSQPVTFQLPNPRNPFSLNPGSFFVCFPESKASEVEKSSNLSAAIAAAQAAATQFSKKGNNFGTNAFQSRNRKHLSTPHQFKSNSMVEHKMASDEVQTPVPRYNKCSIHSEYEENSSSHGQFPHAKSSQHPGPHSKIFAAAVRGLRPA
ncbi:hypothetical protein U1Q18_025773 [Sarracenia purpurea var. burkii]